MSLRRDIPTLRYCGGIVSNNSIRFLYLLSIQSLNWKNIDQLSEAISLLQANQFASAETAFSNLLENGETNPQIHQHLAESQLHQQKFPEAIDTLEAGLKIDPEKKELLTYLSQVFWGTGQRDRALTLHEKVVELNPQDTQLISNQASMHYELNRKDDAVRMFERILEAAPEAHQIHFSIGTIHLEENRYEDAINSFRNGLPNEPNNSYANKQLGMALHISGAIK